MDADKNLDKLKTGLILTVSDFLDRRLPLRRIVFVASILKDSNIGFPFAERLTERLLKECHKDGAWIDCEDTSWALFYLNKLTYKKILLKGFRWLEKEKSGQGWGFCKRDHPSIPMTAQILYLLPGIKSHRESAIWLEKAWEKDISSPIKLNYKAAWYLLAYVNQRDKVNLSKELFHDTVIYLKKEQRVDGSWGPWKEHPAPSNCYSTGICMAALSKAYEISGDSQIRQVLKKSIKWIKAHQLQNGLLPTHYIEEGSAWIYWGWDKAISVVEK